MTGVSLREATTDDLAALVELERVGFDAAERWSSTSWAGELDGADRWVRLAVIDDTVVGAISVQLLPPASDLMRVVVDPVRRRRGIATRLVHAGLDAAAAAGATRMLLEVRHDNDAAIACYGRAGFEQLTARENYYGAGRHALVMRAWDLHLRTTAGARDAGAQDAGAEGVRG
ncbi:MAG TPA: GNAT family N-acetyltransferase [Candidatus Avipropionibacterium avicola]|uniref:GNAT family N-acetyltransferase n=1 Tax=Candidatus Avipropionibacterium avicola TaxID=2840701 RepID=A0A9D1KMZ9_9ACTN|nr:GNAT family N-acetyltransferase [Candidatus Avipropionibacterium avicola]